MEIAFAVFMMVASYMISASMVQKPDDARPSRFEDIDFPRAEEGSTQAVIFGDCWCGDWTVLGVGNYSVSPITK
jgi:hypothetical protein